MLVDHGIQDENRQEYAFLAPMMMKKSITSMLNSTMKGMTTL